MPGGFQLASAWVDIGAKTANWDRALSNVKKQVSNLGNSFTAFSSHIYGFWGALAGAGGGAALAIHAYEDLERADQRLRSALSATGQEVENNFTMLKKFSGQMQQATIYTDQALEGLEAYATNLGVSADKMEDVIKVGVGLGEAFFGGDAQAGIEAAAKAQQGNFRELEKMSKAVKDARTPQDKLNQVVRLGNQGFQQAQDRTKTFEGATKQLGNQVTELGETFGALLVPGMMRGVQWMKATVEMLERTSPAQKMVVIHFAEMAAAIAGVLIFGPALLSFVGDFIALGTALGSVLLSIGRVMVAALFTPIGMIVGGLGVLATGLAYLVGTGNSAVSRIATGFGAMWDYLASTFKDGAHIFERFEEISDNLGFAIRRIFAQVKATFLNLWADLPSGVRNSLDSSWETIKEWGTNVVKFFELLGAQVMRGWTLMTNYLGDKLAKLMLMAPKSLGGMGMTGAQADKAIADVRKAGDRAEESEFHRQQGNFLAGWDDEIAKMQKAWAAKPNETPMGPADVRNQLLRDLAAIDNDQNKANADRTARLSHDSATSFSDRIKALLAGLSKSTGLDGLKQQFLDLQKQFSQIMEQKQPAIAGAGGLTVRAPSTLAFSSMEEAFKKNLEGQFAGADSLTNVTMNHTDAMKQHTGAMQQFSKDVPVIAKALKNVGQGPAKFGP